MRDKVLEKIQKENPKKVMMNFQIDPWLKASFEETCKKDGITMSSAIIAMIETYLEEHNEARYDSIRKNVKEIETLLGSIKGKDAVITQEKIDDMLRLKESISDYVTKHGNIVPDTNEWDYGSGYGIDHYIYIIDVVLQNILKAEK